MFNTVTGERNRKKSVTSKFSLDFLSVTSLASLAALCFLIFIARKLLCKMVLYSLISLYS